MPEPNTMYQVRDEESSRHFQLVWQDDRERWRNHLGQTIANRDFDLDQLVLRGEVPFGRRHEDWKAMELFMQEQDCRGFYHFTDISNLPSIFEHGFIASRTLAERLGLMRVATKGEISRYNHPMDHGMYVQDYARFPVQKHNPILYHWEGIQREGDFVPQPCIIRVDCSIATLAGVRFAATNANTFGQIISGGKTGLESIAIQDIQRKYTDSTRRRQAEILVPHAAPINFVDCVGFRSMGELKRARQLVQEESIRKKMTMTGAFTGQYGTYLGNIHLAAEPDVNGPADKPDETRFEKDSQIRLHCWFGQDREQQRVKISYTWNGGKVPANIFPMEDCYFQFDLQTAAQRRGEWTVHLTLINDDGREFLLYEAPFEVY